MTWTVELDPAAEKALEKLDPQNARRILKFLFERLTSLDDPRSIGEALQGKRFKSLWKYRVGDYRLISSLEDGIRTVFVLEIGDRKDVYR
jgi:mRNA interferase RelE/StbE